MSTCPHLVSCDPGAEAKAGYKCYFARWVRGRLKSVHALDFWQAQEWQAELGSVEVVVEKPQMDQRTFDVPPKVMINLAWNGALCAAALHPFHLHTVAPAQWTTIPKPVLHLRIWKALTPQEQALFPADTLAVLKKAALKYARTKKATHHEHYNTLDAVGIGLFHLGRVGKSATQL